MPIFLVICLERVSKSRCLGAAKRLRALVPKTALVRRDGLLVDIPAAGVMPGETLEVREDGRFPADGVVLSGFGVVDEQPLTGDEKAAEKRPGDTVLAGTLNLAGPLTVRVRRSGSSTIAAQLADMLHLARGGGKSGKKPAAKKTAGFSSSLLARLAVVLALCVFGGWWLWQKQLDTALLRAFTALLTAYPFALVPSGRAAVSAVLLKAAKSGILLHGPEALSQANRADTLLLCKTGALASGPLEITDVAVLPGFFEEELLTFAAAVEKASAHPFALALAAYLKPGVITGAVEENTVRAGDQEFVSMRVSRHGFIGSALPPAERFEEVMGHGVRAMVGGRAVIAGDLTLLKAHKIETGPLESILAGFENEGKTAAAIAINGKAAGVIAAAIPLKPEISGAVGKLIQQGVECFLLTGGGVRAANAIAKRAGILGVLAGVAKAKKAEGVARAQQLGRTVAAVGDASRDKEALDAADIGVCMGPAGPGRASIGVISGNLSLIPFTFGLARTFAKRLRQNLAIAASLGAAGACLAALGLLSPLTAGVYAAFASGIIMWNSWR
jgi:Cu+-exporting ATPase